MIIENKEVRLIDSVQSDLKEKIPYKILETMINNIKNKNDLEKIVNNEKHLLWNWCPSIAYNRFGLEYYTNIKPNKINNHTFVMINPKFISIKEELVEELEKNFDVVSIQNFKFTRGIIAKIYGGFPWYESYYRLCESLDLFEKDGVIIIIKNISDTINNLNNFKERERENYGPSIVKTFVDLEFNGILKPFHTPNHIENERHIKCLEITISQNI